MTDAETAAVLNTAAVLPEELRNQLAAAIITINAADAGTTPQAIARELADSTAWPSDEEWAVERPHVQRLAGNARAYYRRARIVLEVARPQG